MGSEIYWYYVPYEEDKNKALRKLQNREFEAGRYYPVIDNIDFPITNKSESPGKQHKTIKEALESAGESGNGTRSILDLQRVSENGGFCQARVLQDDELSEYFSTNKPTKKLIEDNLDNLIEDIDRGEGLCIIVYKNECPDELFFVGYSFD